jgi:hypothetical protein
MCFKSVSKITADKRKLVNPVPLLIGVISQPVQLGRLTRLVPDKPPLVDPDASVMRR